MMTTEKSKIVFDYSKTFWTKFKNRTHPVIKIAFMLGTAVVLGTTPTIKRALENTFLTERKELFIQDIVMDPKRQDFNYLDEEDMPEPLKPLTQVEQFKQKLKETIESE